MREEPIDFFNPHEDNQNAGNQNQPHELKKVQNQNSLSRTQPILSISKSFAKRSPKIMSTYLLIKTTKISL